jgi:hypothetical protein
MTSLTKFDYKEIGVCGLSCGLCPAIHRKTKSKCLGCKSEDRISLGCTFIRCAVKKKDLEFCILCEDSKTCEKLKIIDSIVGSMILLFVIKSWRIILFLLIGLA